MVLEGRTGPFQVKKARILAWVTIHAMLIQMLSLVLQVVVGMVAGAALLRLYMQWHRIPLAAKAGNPVGPFIFALTNWMVLPLRRIVPPLGRLDTASAIAAYAVVWPKTVLMAWWRMGGGPTLWCRGLPWLEVLALCLSGLFGLVLVHVGVVVGAHRSRPWPTGLNRMAAAVAIARILPTLGGIDLSPLAPAADPIVRSGACATCSTAAAFEGPGCPRKRRPIKPLERAAKSLAQNGLAASSGHGACTCRFAMKTKPSWSNSPMRAMARLMQIEAVVHKLARWCSTAPPVASGGE
jgi:YggT family protein